MSKRIDLEDQWKLYLKLMQLDEGKMPLDQKRELRRAFFGGIGQFLTLLDTKLALMPEAEAVAALEDVTKQLSNFFMNEVNNHN